MDDNWVNHEKSEVQAYIAKSGIASAMNNTKWREVCGAFQNCGFQYRQKHILCETPTDWGGEWYYDPLPYFGIEWLEIATQVNHYPKQWDRSHWVPVDRSDEIAGTLRGLSVPFTREPGAIRIWGYLRPGPKPVFEES